MVGKRGVDNLLLENPALTRGLTFQVFHSDDLFGIFESEIVEKDPKTNDELWIKLKHGRHCELLKV